MINLRKLIGKKVDVEVSGKRNCNAILIGKVIDVGLDVIVIYDGRQFLYIPLFHVQHLELSSSPDDEVQTSNLVPLDTQSEVSYRKVLDQARGRFMEIYVTGNKSIHGYISTVMNDYFAFHSPVYHTVYISLNHVKWIIPYSINATPYSMSNQSFPINPSALPLSRTFEQQCKRIEGNLVVFDLGDDPDKIGFLQKVDNNMIELVKANGELIYWSIHHLKTMMVHQ